MDHAFPQPLDQPSLGGATNPRFTTGGGIAAKKLQNHVFFLNGLGGEGEVSNKTSSVKICCNGGFECLDAVSFFWRKMTFWKKCLHHALIFAILSMMNKRTFESGPTYFPLWFPSKVKQFPFFNKDYWFPQRAFVRRLYYDIFRLFFGRGSGQRNIMHSSPLQHRRKNINGTFLRGPKKGSFSPLAGYENPSYSPVFRCKLETNSHFFGRPKCRSSWYTLVLGQFFQHYWNPQIGEARFCAAGNLL